HRHDVGPPESSALRVAALAPVDRSLHLVDRAAVEVEHPASVIDPALADGRPLAAVFRDGVGEVFAEAESVGARFGHSYYLGRGSSGFGYGYGGNRGRLAYGAIRGRFAPPDRVGIGFPIGYPMAVFAVRVGDLAGNVPALVVPPDPRL